LTPSERANSSITKIEDDVDSLFGGPAEQEKTRDEILQMKLEELVTQGRPGSSTKSTVQSPKTSNSEIASKREELMALVLCAMEAGSGERRQIHRQRESLVAQITRLKAVEREKEMMDTKGKFLRFVL